MYKCPSVCNEKEILKRERTYKRKEYSFLVRKNVCYVCKLLFKVMAMKGKKLLPYLSVLNASIR